MEINLYGLLNKAKCLSTTGQQLFYYFFIHEFLPSMDRTVIRKKRRAGEK